MKTFNSTINMTLTILFHLQCDHSTMAMVKKLYHGVVCSLISTTLFFIFLKMNLIQNQIRIVIFEENGKNHTTDVNTKECKQGGTGDKTVYYQFKMVPDQTSLSVGDISSSFFGILNLTDLLRLSGFAGIPDLHSRSHPFNKRHYLKSFIGHIYRRFLSENKTELYSESERNIHMNYQAYKHILYKKADKNKTIILATVDLAYIDMAINLYETSFKKFNLQNYVFACSQQEATNILMSHGIDAITLWSDSQGNETSDYNTEAFNRKTRYKTLATVIALNMGFSVLLMDVDIVFLKNPFPFFTCNSCDIIFQSEGGETNRNTGFYLAFPTNNTIKMHLLALDSYKLSETFNDQDAIKQITDAMQADGDLKIQVLNKKLFPNGVSYFDDGCRMFGDDNLCHDCVIVHNNDIISYSNKVYRFKEHFMWVIDTNGYYSNEKAKYLTFENTLRFSTDKEMKQAEMRSLKTALLIGHILKRILILPTFHCPKDTSQRCSKLHTGCPAYMHLNMTSVDAEFSGDYREHLFLHNSNVPKSVKHSVSDLILVNTSMTSDTFKSSDMKEIKHI